MKFGAVFPQNEIGDNPDDLREYVTTVEELGYDYVIMYDHVLGANPDRPGGWQGPYTHESMFHEPLTTFAWMAAFTQRLEFVTSILILPQRQTALVAKQATQLDVLSGGRLRLGVAVGWNPVEYEALGEDFSKRGKRLDEQVEVLRLLWQQRLVTYEGEFHTIDDAGLYPMPVQRPIPLWFGGMSDAAMRRAARVGDGWMPNPVRPEKAPEWIDKLHGFLREAGRDPQKFGLDVRCSLRHYDDPEGWGQFVLDWAELGATHTALNTMYVGLESLDEHLGYLRRFIQTVRG